VQVGFGYLMTFLQHYGLGAVGFTMLITTIVVQWSIVVEGIFLVLSDTDAHSFPMSISFLELIDGNFAAATVLISFGALIGKVRPRLLRRYPISCLPRWFAAC
jgi:ammonium transporter Rh